jgi:hypothetical protein
MSTDAESSLEEATEEDLEKPPFEVTLPAPREAWPASGLSERARTPPPLLEPWPEDPEPEPESEKPAEAEMAKASLSAKRAPRPDPVVPVADPDVPMVTVETALPAKRAPRSAVSAGNAAAQDSLHLQETGVLVRPSGWSADQVETALIDMSTVRKAVEAAADEEAAEARPVGRLRRAARKIGPSRGVLLGILTLQGLLSLRDNNTAFEDEALYLYAGHLELAHLVNGAPLPQDFSSYFSGSPVLYPVVGAVADQIGGLAGARLLSMFCMLLTTTLLYMTTKRLFDERVAVCSAALFSLLESTLFLGHFATYDAPALCLLATATWTVVRSARSTWPYFLLAAIPAVLAVGTKYAALLFVPTIVVLSAIVAFKHHGRWALLRPVLLLGLIGSMIAGLLKLAGSAYVQGVDATTTERAQGTTTISTLLRESAEWGGVVFGVAVVGALIYVARPDPEPGRGLVSSLDRFGRVCLALLLLGTALLAPADQMHLHTDVSFQKHIGFGLLFAAPLAGYAMVRVVGEHFRRVQLAIGVWVAVLALGMGQSHMLFGVWPNSAQLISAMRQFQKPGANYLVEVDEVPIYYLKGDPDAEPQQFTSTFVMNYTDKQGQFLTGIPAYEAAVKDGYFQIIVYTNNVTPAVDSALSSTLAADASYRLAVAIPERTSYGAQTYYVWVKK